MMTHTYTHPCPHLIVCTNTFLFHVYRGVSLARMQRYTQLTYFFNQCATSLISRDRSIAVCTVRHPGVELPFSSYIGRPSQASLAASVAFPTFFISLCSRCCNNLTANDLEVDICGLEHTLIWPSMFLLVSLDHRCGYGSPVPKLGII